MFVGRIMHTTDLRTQFLYHAILLLSYTEGGMKLSMQWPLGNSTNHLQS